MKTKITKSRKFFPEEEDVKEKKKGFFDKWVENLKDFLDNAE